MSNLGAIVYRKVAQQNVPATLPAYFVPVFLFTGAGHRSGTESYRDIDLFYFYFFYFIRHLQ